MIQYFPYLLLRAPILSLKNAYNHENSASDILEEGIYVSSPEFYQELKKTNSLSPKEQDRVRLSFAKFHLRSCCRCTPYGSFAGCSLIPIGDGDTKIELGSPDKHLKQVRIDMNYLTQIINAILKTPVIRDKFKVYPNNTLYELGDTYRYVEYVIKNNIRFYSTTSVVKNRYTKLVLETAKNGISIPELVKQLIEREKVDGDEAYGFISEMYEAQLLISDLEPAVTGLPPLESLISKLSPFKELNGILSGLIAVKEQMDQFPGGVKNYVQIEELLKKFGAGVEIPKNTLQTDLFLNMISKNINKDILDKITAQVNDLLVFSEFAVSTDLENFKRNFLAKYDLQEVELLVALDPEHGIGYGNNNQNRSGGSEWIDDLVISNSSKNFMVPFSSKEQFVISKYLNYLNGATNSIEIAESELADFKDNPAMKQFLSSFYLMGSLMRSSADREDFILDVFGTGGPPASRLLARFAHGGRDIFEFSRKIWEDERENYDDAIIFEFVHLPQARISNVLLRPVISDYEMPYCGKSGHIESGQISVRDVLVSVRNNKVILKSKKLKKRIIPRLTTAHNFIVNALPIYKFMGDLQSQNAGTVNFWDWGILSFKNHLPRVTYKNLILKKAQWIINLKDLQDLPGDPNLMIGYFDMVRAKVKMPVRVMLVENTDNKLLIDFSNNEGVELFSQYLKKYKSVLIEEFLFDNDNCVVIDAEGRPYVNEVIIPLKRTSEIKEKPIKLPGQSGKLKRHFTLNSEWIYFKVYCGPVIAEKLLKNQIKRFVLNGHKKGLFEQFFFIRYSDEGHHIRIRFFNAKAGNQAGLQNAFLKLLQPFLDKKIVDRVIIDTYSREIERYGSDLIAEIEQIFFHDSITVLKLLELLDNDDFEKYRMILCFLGIESLLDDFGLDTSDKKSLLKRLSAGFLNEFGGTPELFKQLNVKYHARQKELSAYMSTRAGKIDNIDIAKIRTILEDRSKLNAPIIASVKLKLKGDFERCADLLGSVIHMYANRLFISQQRKYELVAYHFLERYYTSQYAIIQKQHGTHFELSDQSR